MDNQDNVINAKMAEIESEHCVPGAAKVLLKEDGFLKIVIDLNVNQDLFVETRVGAYGTLLWAQELAQRWLMMKEMRRVKEKAVEADKNKLIPPPNGVIDIRGMR